MQQPDFKAGVEYWASTEATLTSVLGGYDHTTPVPRLDEASSRMLLLSLFPSLSTIKPPHLRSAGPLPSTPPTPLPPKRSFRALDCGAGIGRITSTVLLPLFHRVDLVEPVDKFVAAAEAAGRKGKEGGWKLLNVEKDGEPRKGVRMWRAGLQHFDPSRPAVPLAGGEVKLLATLGSGDVAWPDPGKKDEEGYDLVMVQWCVGHLNDDELVAFLKRAKGALRKEGGKVAGYVVLKENTCRDDADEGRGSLFDDDDSSITRSDKVFRKIFADAELELVRREVQQGFPKELFPVVAYVLR